MKASFKLVPSLLAALLLLAAGQIVSAQTVPLRSYAISGIENDRYYDATRGWVYSTNPFTGTLAFLSPTNAQITKVFADGTSVSRELILHWWFDPAVATQGGTAVEVPDPTDPLIRRTTWSLGLQYDGLRYNATGSFQTRAWMSVLPGVYDWFNVAYGDFSGHVVSPIGSYHITGSEKAGKTTVNYTGVLTLSSPSSGQLMRSYAGGVTTTVTLAVIPPLDLASASQTVTAVQLENTPNQSTSYAIGLELNGSLYSANSVYATTQTKERKTTTVSSGSFDGAQP